MNIESRATLVAMIISFFLIIIKFTAGLLSGSMAIMTSALDSVFDLFFSIINYFTSKTSAKSPSKDFNYGFGKVEALSTLFQGIALFLIGIYIIVVSIYSIIIDKEVSRVGLVIVVIFLSFLSTLFIVIYLKIASKKSDSLIIKSELIHYRMDLYTNASLLISFIVLYYTGYSKIDFFLSIFIAFYVLWCSFKIIKNAVKNILDVSLDYSLLSKIIDILNKSNDIDSYHDLRTRKSGNYNFVDVHLVMGIDKSLLEAHYAGDRVEDAIVALSKSSKWLINIHLDPYDDSEIIIKS